mmetsp:Transcript_68746/g.212637  ORF Transcript_68746/g.212637 Transcript_68746/m.212637 type:complete len:392 (-) Transcript_68746:42-1217(-)
MADVPEAQVDPVADRLFVTKIPQQASREEVAAHFSRFGLTTDVYLPSIPGVPGHKGIAFVSYSDPTALQLAISNGPHEIHGHEVVVDVAAPRNAVPHIQAQMTTPAGLPPELPPAPEQPTTTDRLFVTKVPPVLQREHIREHFAQFGELTDVYMPTVPGSTGHKGICFISFSDPMSLQFALQHSPHEIHGHAVVVDVAAPRGSAPAPGAPRPAAGLQGFAFATAPAAPAPQAAPGWPGTAVAGAALSGLGGLGGLAGLAAAGYAAAAAAPAGPPGGMAQGTPVPGRLFVTRVTPDMTKVDLQLYFQQFGQLDDVYIPTGGKGIAFVSFRDAAVSQRVLQAQQHFVKPGKAVVVDQAIDRPPLSGRGGGLGGGGGGAAAFGSGMQPGRYMPY